MPRLQAAFWQLVSYNVWPESAGGELDSSADLNSAKSPCATLRAAFATGIGQGRVLIVTAAVI